MSRPGKCSALVYRGDMEHRPLTPEGYVVAVGCPEAPTLPAADAAHGAASPAPARLHAALRLDGGRRVRRAQRQTRQRGHRGRVQPRVAAALQQAQQQRQAAGGHQHLSKAGQRGGRDGGSGGRGRLDGNGGGATDWTAGGHSDAWGGGLSSGWRARRAGQRRQGKRCVQLSLGQVFFCELDAHTELRQCGTVDDLPD